jgi:hypothetical protein
VFADQFDPEGERAQIEQRLEAVEERRARGGVRDDAVDRLREVIPGDPEVSSDGTSVRVHNVYDERRPDLARCLKTRTSRKRGLRRSGVPCASPRASRCQHARAETGPYGFDNPHGKRNEALERGAF